MVLKPWSHWSWAISSHHVHFFKKVAVWPCFHGCPCSTARVRGCASLGWPWNIEGSYGQLWEQEWTHHHQKLTWGDSQNTFCCSSPLIRTPAACFSDHLMKRIEIKKRQVMEQWPWYTFKAEDWKGRCFSNPPQKDPTFRQEAETHEIPVNSLVGVDHF